MMVLNNFHIVFYIGYLKLKDPKSQMGHANSDTHKDLIQKAVWMEELSEATKPGCLFFPIKV